MAVLIRGTEEDQNRIANNLQYAIGKFPCNYLGIPLSINQLTKTEWQPLFDQVKKFILAWQKCLIHRPGRLVLIKSVVSARPIHQLMILDAPAWVFEEINGWM